MMPGRSNWRRPCMTRSMPGVRNRPRTWVSRNDDPRRARSIRPAAWLILWGLVAGSLARAAAPDDAEARVARGRSLFLREWVPGEPSGPGGDGLGPVYNETSCVACHDQGGAGGGGPASRNVDLIAAAETTDIDGGKGGPGRDRASGPDEEALIELHAG